MGYTRAISFIVVTILALGIAATLLDP